MKTFYVDNRSEFSAKIKAKSAKEAKEIFLQGKAKKYELIGDLWEEYVTVTDKNGNEINV